MKLSKQLKVEGIAIMILLILLCVGTALRFLFPGAFGIYDIFVVMLTSPLLVLILVVVLIYWIYQIIQYQKQH